MAQRYILVETEEKRQTLQAVMQGQNQVLVVPTLAAVVEPKNGDHLAFGAEGFLFRPVPASHDALKLMLENGEADIYLAFDRSERGEYGCWLWAGMIGQLSKGARQCRRLHLAGLDEIGISKAMELVEPIDSSQAACFYFEECFQRCLATHLQRLLGTHSGPGDIPLSMPVLAILTLLAEREQEVREFSGTPRWHVELSLNGPRGEFAAHLQEVFGVSCDGALTGREQAKEVAEDLVGQSFRVVSRQENSLKIPAPQPYTLYGLILDAHRYGHIPVAAAMAAASALVSGVALGGKRQALISSLYPVALGKKQHLVEALQQYVVARFGPEALQGRPLREHGIMPLNVRVRPEDISELTDVQQRIYDLIWRRALASQMRGGIGKEIILDLETDRHRVQNDSRLIEEPGFLQVYQYGFDGLMAGKRGDALLEGEEAKVAQVIPEQRFAMPPALYTLPALADDLAELGMERPEEVVALFGKLCVADYVQGQGDGTLQCGPNLFKVVNVLNRAFPGMTGMHFVGYYAQTIEEVASGRKRFQMALKQFEQNLIMQGKPLVKIKLPASISPRQLKSKSIIKGDDLPQGSGKVEPLPADSSHLADYRQPEDGGQPQAADQPFATEIETSSLVPAGGREDVTLSAGAPRVTAAKVADEEEVAPAQEEDASAHGEEERTTPGHGGESIVLDMEAEEQTGMAAGEGTEQVFLEEDGPGPLPGPAERGGGREESGPYPKQEEQGLGRAEVATKPCPQCGRPMVLKGDRFGKFWACTGVPACRHTEGATTDNDGEILSCPLCQQGQLVVKSTPTGKNMYVCSGKACEFMAWSRPHPIHCPLCSSPFLVEKKRPSGEVVLRCPKAGCNYSQEVPGREGLDAAVSKKKVVVRRKVGSSTGSGMRKVVVRRKK